MLPWVTEARQYRTVFLPEVDDVIEIRKVGALRIG